MVFLKYDIVNLGKELDFTMFGFKKRGSLNMTDSEAEVIVNLYGAALAKGGFARPLSFLPFSKARIKYAYYMYLEALINKGFLTNETAENLINTYAMLPSFVDDNEAERINNIIKVKKQQGLDLNKLLSFCDIVTL